MRILMLTHNPVGKGADFWRAFYLARQLGHMGHSVTLAGAGAPDRDDYLPPSRNLVTVAIPERSGSRVSRAGYSPLEVIERLIRLREEKFDLIHSFGHRPTVSLVARWLKRRSGALQVADWSDLWGRGGIADVRRLYGRLSLGQSDHWLEHRNVMGADGLTVVSTELADLARLWGKPPGHIHQLGVGAAVDVIKPQDKLQARRWLGIQPARHVLLHSGQSALDRHHASEVIRRVLELDPDSVIVQLGVSLRIKPGTMHSQTRTRLVRPGYLRQSDLGMALGGSDLVLLPLPDRGFNRVRLPNRVGDAAAAARAIATNPTGQVGRLIEEHKVGIAVDEDPARMAAQVVELLADQRSLERIGRNARRLAEDEWSWAVLAPRVAVFYQRLSASP